MTDTIGRAQVTCPECGTVADVSAGGRAASDFCPACDYPLFWARATTAPAAGSVTDDARLRAPGTGGTTTASSLPCPACGEQNPPAGVTCLRCAADLRPAPPPAPEPVPPPVPVVVHAPAPIVRCDHLPSWAVAAIAALTTFGLTASAFLIWG